MRGGRNIPTLQQAWSLKGKLMVKMHRGQLIVQKWPGSYGPPRSQAQADTITAFKQIQRAMKSQQPAEWVTAIEQTKLTGMYPRDYLFSCMSGNMHLVESFLTGAISAAVDRLQQFIAVGTETSWTFAGIPPGYAALLITYCARSRSATTTASVGMTFNQDGAAHYDYDKENRFATSQTIATTQGLASEISSANAPASYPGVGEILLPSYSNTNFFKSWLGRSTTIATQTAAGIWKTDVAGWWRNVAPITQIDMTLGTGPVKGSTFTLYGLY